VADLREQDAADLVAGRLVWTDPAAISRESRA
jgi:hypothetical protein